MKFRNVLILGFLCVVLAGYILLFERYQQSTDEQSRMTEKAN